MKGDLRAFARYASGLPAFLRDPIDGGEARRRVRAQLANRADSFLGAMEQGIFRVTRSPYRHLLDHAGVERGDLEALVREGGVEATLERLHGAGVYVTLEEFKGCRPVQRGSLSLAVQAADFDNPTVRQVLPAATGGSRGAPRRVAVDFDQLAQNALYHRLFLESFGLGDRPVGLWRAAPPGAAGLGGAIGFAKAGRPLERWFSPHPASLSHAAPRDVLLVAYTCAASRLARRPVPWPEHVPLSDPAPVALWLAAAKAKGAPALLNTTSSAGVRVCRAAAELGLDVEGTFLRLGGEPYTAGKAAVIGQSGCRAASNYTMTEAGRIGIACADPVALDDLHLTIDQLAVIQRPRQVLGGERVGALLVTTLLPSAPKLMLNVETDDYGTLEVRDCGCLLGRLGLTRHAHGIRSYEKLTSEGMTFLGSELIELIDEVLPQRFGGRPTDYQLVEEERDGVPAVAVVVSPAVGPVAQDELLAAVVSVLRRGPAYRRMMTSAWRDGGTLRVLRREPYATPGAKILPLHVLDAGEPPAT